MAIDDCYNCCTLQIVRGKAGKKTEFGAKISISDDNGFVDVD